MATSTTPEVRTNVKQGALIGGIVCLLLGLAVCFLSVWLFFIYGPLFLVAFILAVVAMAQRRILGGLVLLLATLTVAPAFVFCLTLTRAANFAATHPPPVLTGVAPPLANPTPEPPQERSNPTLPIPPAPNAEATKSNAPAPTAEPAKPVAPAFQWTVPDGLGTLPPCDISGVVQHLEARLIRSSASFSHDDRHIAYLRADPDFNLFGGEYALTLVVKDLATLKEELALPMRVYSSPVVTAWSPDDQKIAVMGNRGGATAVIVEIKTKKTTKVDLSGNYPNFDSGNPLGMMIEWTGPSQIYTLTPKRDSTGLPDGYGLIDDGGPGVLIDLDTLNTIYPPTIPFRAFGPPQPPSQEYSDAKQKYSKAVEIRLHEGQFELHMFKQQDRTNPLFVCGKLQKGDFSWSYDKVIYPSCSGFRISRNSTCAVAELWAENGVYNPQLFCSSDIVYFDRKASIKKCVFNLGAGDPFGYDRANLEPVITKIKNGTHVVVQFQQVDPKLNPLNGKIVGVNSSKYLGEGWIDTIDGDKCTVLVAWDIGLKNGLTVAGAFIPNGKGFDTALSPDTYWGTISDTMTDAPDIHGQTSGGR